MNRKTVLIGILALLIPVGAAAQTSQTSTQEAPVTDLQRQLQEMRSQINKMQGRIDELETAKANAGTNPGDQLDPQFGCECKRLIATVTT